MIPKIIHFVWVGTKDKPKLVNDCINSWKRFCPDYQIIEWNNESLKDIDNLYVKQAFDNHKWAFVSDYLRLYALKLYGGFYCDTDLEITASIDKFRKYEFVSGYEKFNDTVAPITAFMGATKNNKLISDLLEEYNNIPFIVNGVMDETTNTMRISKYFLKNYGLKKPYDNREISVLEEGHIIFPSFIFCTPENNEDNYAIHHFNGSWIDPYSRKNKCNFGKYKLVRFVKRPNVDGEYMPIYHNEKKVFGITFLGKKYLILKNI